MAATKTRNKQQSAALRSEIYKRFCAGQTQAAIAAALSVHQTNVAYHVAKARDANQIEIEHHKADRLAELDHLRSEAWSAWEQDKTPQGAALLTQIQKAIQQERTLLGLDAPARTTTTLSVEHLPTDTIDTIISHSQGA